MLVQPRLMTRYYTKSSNPNKKIVKMNFETKKTQFSSSVDMQNILEKETLTVNLVMSVHIPYTQNTTKVHLHLVLIK